MPKKLGLVVEVSLIIAYITYLFIVFPFREAIVLFTIASATYAYFEMLLNRDKHEKYKQLKEQLLDVTVIEIVQTKKFQRLIVDILLTVFVMAGSVIFLLFAPETYAILKFFIVMAIIPVLIKTIERISIFSSTRLFWIPEEEKLMILTRFQPREFPLKDLKRLESESSPDLLRLHPMFTFLSSNVDVTASFQPVLKLSFPGEHIFMTPDEIGKWSNEFRSFVPEISDKPLKEILPLWHPTVLKRLFWKGYFAIAVKGISAYTGLIFLLYWLGASPWIIVLFVLIWWLFNMYVSDRVLIAATDATRVTEGELYEQARTLFKRANVENTQLYVTDSPIYNGFATGMNIGRATIMLTTATTELPEQAIDAILAHEAIHVKKRDVLINQLARMAFFGLLALTVYLFYDTIVSLAERPFLLITIFYLLFFLFPIYQSFVAQWTEGRADNLGATLLQEGRQQMAAGLRELALASEKDLVKSLTYQSVNEQKRKTRRSELERQHWFVRVIEFQFQAHPPMYWRIHSLETYHSWREARKKWMIARITESLPSFK